MPKSRPLSSFPFFSAMVLLTGLSNALAQPLQEAPLVGLEETLLRALRTDAGVLRGRMAWMSSEAEIESIRNRGGWTLELGGESRMIDGSRRETRDSSLGRSEQDILDPLDENERYLILGLTNSFLEERRKQKKDILDEKVRQIDSGDKFASDTGDLIRDISEAYLDCYYGTRAIELLQEEIGREHENLRMHEERLAVEETLRGEVLAIRSEIAALESRRLEWELKRSRGLEVLRRLWSANDLAPAEVSAPRLEAASSLVSLPIEDLTRMAWDRRSDIQLKRAALTTVDRRHPYTKSLPEMDVGVSARYGDHERDFADEGREDSGLDVRFELEVRIPLSQVRRNDAQERQFLLERRARAYELEDLEEEAAKQVRLAYDDLLLAGQEVRIRQLELAHALESQRLILLTAEEMPETLAGDPLNEIRKARREVLEAQVTSLLADRDRIERMIDLHLAVGGFGNLPFQANPSIPSRQE